jgi:hypothetical protein
MVFVRALIGTACTCGVLFPTHNHDWLAAASFSRIDIAMLANSGNGLAIIYYTGTGTGWSGHPLEPSGPSTGVGR